MVHTFEKFGLKIVVDVASGSIFTVDSVAYEVIKYYKENGSFDGVEDALEFDKQQIAEAVFEVKSLIEQGVLFSEDTYKDMNLIEKRNLVIKAMCLHVAHDCDLRCRYCFASSGSFKQERKLMSFDVGKKAIGFLLQNSGSRQNLELIFLVESHF